MDSLPDKTAQEHHIFQPDWNPKVLWDVTIPKDNELHIQYTKEINWWARMWMKFIGWGVERPSDWSKE